MVASSPADGSIKLFKTAAAWEKWLAAHVAGPGIWMQFAKQGQGVSSVSYADAIDVALCHGWIDGQVKSLDAQFYLRRFTPRGKNSVWSKINVAKAAALIETGRMRPAGMREIDDARADGRWEVAYDSASTMPVPEELAAALAKNSKAKSFFDKLDKTNRYAVCWRVQTARKPETRAARVKKLVAMLARGEKIHS